MENTSNGTNPSPIVSPVNKSTTADDLLSMYENEEAETNAQVSKEVDKQARVIQELPKKLAANQVVEDLDRKANEGQTQAGSEEEAAQTDKGDETKEEQAALKVIKAKLNEEDVEIPEDAIIPVKVNNKDFQVSVKDAVNAYVKQEEINRNINKRMQVADQKERGLSEQYRGIQDKAAQVIKFASEGQFVPGIRALAKMAGVETQSDVVALEEAMFNHLDEIRKVWTEMNPEQRALHLANRRAEELKKENEQFGSAAKNQQATQELVGTIHQLAQENGLSIEQFGGLYHEIGANFVGEGKKFATPDDIGPTDVIEFHQHKQHSRKIVNAVNQVNPALLEDPSFIDSMFRATWADDKIRAKDVKDYVDIVKVALGTPSKGVENLNRKVDRANSQGLRSQLKGQAASTKKTDKVDDEMYDHFFGKRSVSGRF